METDITYIHTLKQSAGKRTTSINRNDYSSMPAADDNAMRPNTTNPALDAAPCPPATVFAAPWAAVAVGLALTTVVSALVALALVELECEPELCGSPL